MMRKDRLNTGGFALILGVTAFFALNQVIIKETSVGLAPVFQAGLRSALAVVFVGAWLGYRGLWGRVRRADLGAGLAIGTVFAIEFLALFVALDLTSVSRAAILFYSMPVWFALMAHFGLPGQRLTRRRTLGLALAFAGTALAISTRGGGGTANIWGDICALIGAMGWAGTAFLARATQLHRAGPEAQLFWMVLVSAVILLALAPFAGPMIRDIAPIHWVGLLFQASVVVTAGFILWLFLLSRYPSGTVTSFSFATPVFSILAGYLVYDESILPQIVIAAILIGMGILLINRQN